MRLVSLVLLVTMFQAAPGQGLSGIKEIQRYIKQIDSLSGIRGHLNMDSEKEPPMMPRVYEGFIENKKRGLSGGFSKVFVINSAGDSLYMVQYSDNLELDLLQTYYYRHHKLIGAEIILTSDSTGEKVLFGKKLYYRNDKVIFHISNGSGMLEKYAWRVASDPLEAGYRFLREFEEERTRR